MSNPISAATAQYAARLYKALADPVRLRLISLVRFTDTGEAPFDMPQSSLNHHLRNLVAAGILTRERRGTWTWYCIQQLPLHVASELPRIGGPLRASLGAANGP